MMSFTDDEQRCNMERWLPLLAENLNTPQHVGLRFKGGAFIKWPLRLSTDLVKASTRTPAASRS